MRALGLVLVCASIAWADTISFSDTEFANGDWTQVEEADTASSATLTINQNSSGGNPGAYQRGTHTWTAASSVVYVHLFSPSGGASVDPSLGAITSIDFSFDANVFLPLPTSTFDPAVGFRFVVEQGGNYYINDSGLVTSQSEGWETHSLSGLSAANFIALNGTGGATLGDNPDFSIGGGAVQFGYVTSNTANQAFENEWGVDNWSVTVNTEGTSTNPIPEPGTYALFGMALIGYGIYRRRKAS